MVLINGQINRRSLGGNFKLFNEMKNWATHPSKKTLILFTLVSLIGVTLVLLADTDLFRESMSTWGKGAIGGSLLANFKLFLNYSKNKAIPNEETNTP